MLVPPVRVPMFEGEAPSDHLLRTFAAVPCAHRVLDLGCGHRCHAGPLALLGFDLHACAVDLHTVTAVRGILSDLVGLDEAQQRIIAVPRLAALGYPDAFFDWIVAYDVYRTHPAAEALAEARRVLKPGGWIYVAVPLRDKEGKDDGFTSESLDDIMKGAGFVCAEQPTACETDGRCLLEGIYRRVEAETPA